MIYLDHNATSPLRPEAEAAMLHALQTTGNPSSVHAAGRAARALVEDAREAIAGLLGHLPESVVFTSGATEANASALWGAVHGALDEERRITRLFVSAIEHPSVRANAQSVAARVGGIRLVEVPANADGTVDVDVLRVLLREGKGRALVAVMAANNETGVIQPLDEVSTVVREAGGLLLVDAVQAAGRSPLASEADYLTISSHKLGGPQGAGALAIKKGAPFAPHMSGGGQERGMRGGTQNVAAIAGFGAAAATSAKRSDIERLSYLRDRFEAELLRRRPDAVIFGRHAPRLCNTSNFALPGIAAENALIALDLDGVCVSSGSACSSGRVAASAVLTAMGVEENLARGALRLSLGWNSREEDIEALLLALERFLARARPRAAA